jgi:FkbM family methyltransferase
MFLVRQLIQRLDRRGGRKALGTIATWYIQSRLKVDGAVFYDGCWMHRVQSAYYADSPQFRYHTDEVLQWAATAQDFKDQAQDHWCHCFKLEPSMVIIDVGAGTGTDALFFSRAVGPTGKVIAIEAHPHTFAMLQATCRWNGLHNVTPLNYAVMDRKCHVYVEDRPNHVENSVAVEKGENHLATGIPAASLDDICRDLKLERIDYVKMNIEGAERFAIQGMSEVVRQTRAITIACHDFRASSGAEFSTRAEVVRFLTSHGFVLYKRDDDPRPHVRDHIYAIRQ